MFRQLLLDSQYILRAIDAQVRLACLQHMDFKTVLQRSQLFERFSAFQRRRRKRCEGSQSGGLITVQPDMTVGAGERRAGEIERASVESGDHFDDITRLQLL